MILCKCSSGKAIRGSTSCSVWFLQMDNPVLEFSWLEFLQVQHPRSPSVTLPGRCVRFQQGRVDVCGADDSFSEEQSHLLLKMPVSIEKSRLF